MKILSKKGLLKQKHLAPSYIFKNKTKNGDYMAIIVKFTQSDVVKELLLDYVNSLPFVLSIRVLENQLNLLKPLTLDEQIKIINTTIEKGWNSLKFAYEKVTKGKKICK
jgi:hypothetical protein